MKFSLSWLKRHIDSNASPCEIADKLTDLGLEIEGLHNPADIYSQFSVAKVLEANPHPDADRLQVCKVQSASGISEIVCGAPNARAGINVIYAPEGSRIPESGDVLKKAKIRGVESRGMMVSMAEMALSDESDGIIEIDDCFDVGTPMVEAMNLDDPIFDIALTPNRGDCAGVSGVARDLAASGFGELKDQSALEIKLGEIPSKITLENEVKEQCRAFYALEISGLKNTKSPEWLQKLLLSAGVTPSSSIVDVTNFFALDAARPMHAYDSDKISGSKLFVKLAKKGDKFDALNGTSYTMQGGEIAVCDGNSIVALGGIMGGEESACCDTTSSIILEAAVFDASSIAKTGRFHGIESASRYRFERGVDEINVASDLKAAGAFIIDLCGGKAGDVVAYEGLPSKQHAVKFDSDYNNKITGLSVSKERQEGILKALGFDFAGENAKPPSWRHDISCSADLAEEIARIIGYGAIPENKLPMLCPVKIEDSSQDNARFCLNKLGFNECVTPSFMCCDLAKPFGGQTWKAAISSITIENPIASNMNTLRPSILPNLIEASIRSYRKGNGDCTLCEVGPIFFGGLPEEQETSAATIRSGNAVCRNWSDAQRDVDVFDAKADALDVLLSCGVKESSVQLDKNDLPEAYHPSKSGTIRQGKTILGFFGELHPRLSSKIYAQEKIVMSEVFLDRVRSSRKSKTIPKIKTFELQPITRDFSFIVDNDAISGKLIKAIERCDQKLIQCAKVFDVYEGVEDGKKSLAVCVTIQPIGKNAMTDDDLLAVSDKIIAAAKKSVGAELRN